MVEGDSAEHRGETHAEGKCLQFLTGRNSSVVPAAFAWFRKTAPLAVLSRWTSRSGSRTKSAPDVCSVTPSSTSSKESTTAGGAAGVSVINAAVRKCRCNACVLLIRCGSAPSAAWSPRKRWSFTTSSSKCFWEEAPLLSLWERRRSLKP